MDGLYKENAGARPCRGVARPEVHSRREVSDLPQKSQRAANFTNRGWMTVVGSRQLTP